MKSYGTEGRELLDTTGQTNFVPPQDTVHTYLLFRGQDIKDLHVHEKQSTPAVAADSAPAKEEAAPAVETKKEESISEQPKETKKDTTSAKAKTESKENKPIAKKSGNQKKNMVGSGASLLNKKTRGGKGEESEYRVSRPRFYASFLFLFVCSCH